MMQTRITEAQVDDPRLCYVSKVFIPPYPFSSDASDEA